MLLEQMPYGSIVAWGCDHAASTSGTPITSVS